MYARVCATQVWLLPNCSNVYISGDKYVLLHENKTPLQTNLFTSTAPAQLVLALHPLTFQPTLSSNLRTMSARAPLPILAARRQMRVRSLPQPLLLHDKRCPLAQIGLERRKVANILSLQHVRRVRRAENDVKAAIPARFQQLQAEMGAMPVANHDCWVVWRAIPQHASL